MSLFTHVFSFMDSLYDLTGKQNTCPFLALTGPSNRQKADKQRGKYTRHHRKSQVLHFFLTAKVWPSKLRIPA